MTDTGATDTALGDTTPSACTVLSVEVERLRQAVVTAAGAELGEMGLQAGLRPAADVTALLSIAASAEYTLARHLDAAQRAGALPLPGAGAMAAAQAWSPGTARRLARTGAFAADHPEVASAWAIGRVTGEHVDALARRADRLSHAEMTAVVAELDPHFGHLTPAAVARFIDAAIRLLHPPPDPEPDERAAYAARALSFSVLDDTVMLAGVLPRVEGEAVMAAIDALAERLRTQDDQTPAAARRADALVQLVNDAHACGVLPTRGGLPASLTVTVEHAAGHPVATTSRGHVLTRCETRFVACDPVITSIAVAATGLAGGQLAALARALLQDRQPLDVGRAQRVATPAQRRALALRDRGCVIPGCGVPAEACQIHHLEEWADGGATDLDNVVMLCWAHHRQVDLTMWTIAPKDQPPPPGALTWSGNNGSPWTICTQPRTRWRT